MELLLLMNELRLDTHVAPRVETFPSQLRLLHRYGEVAGAGND